METLREKRSRAGRLGAAARWGGTRNGKVLSGLPSADGMRAVDRHRQMMARLRQPDAGWYRIHDAAGASDEDTVLIDIYDTIGWWGVDAQTFVKDLRQITAPSIELHINSEGGDVFDAIAIYNALRQHPANVHVVVDALAASAASFIAMAGDRITATPNCMLMVHDPLGIVIGNAAEMRELADLLDKHGDNIASIYARRAGGDVADWRQRMLDETWYTADEALDAGLVDDIDDAAGEQPPVADAGAVRPTDVMPPVEPAGPDEEKREAPAPVQEPTRAPAAIPGSTAIYTGEPAIAASWYLPDPKEGNPQWMR